MKKNAAVVCDFDVRQHPDSDNALCYAKLLEAIGYETCVIGFDAMGDESLHYARNGINCVVEGYHADGNVFQRIRGGTKKLKTAIAKWEVFFSNCTVVIYLGAICGALFDALKERGDQYGFKIICQICEWFDAKRFFSGCANPAAFAAKLPRFATMEYSKRVKQVKNRNVIVISKMLEEYYAKRNCLCLRLPSLIESGPYADRREDFSKITFGYFGSPGWHNSKDLLNNILNGFALLDDEELERMYLRLCGVEYEDLTPKYDVPEHTLVRLKDMLQVYGRVPKEHVGGLLEQCDFTVLLRESTRSINCGLSSKMTESMSHGVPLLCNITSNMDEYVKDGLNGVVCGGERPEDLLAGLRRVLAMSVEERGRYKKEAWQTAKRMFDYRAYVEPFRRYIEEVIG